MSYIECRCDIYICKENRIVKKDYNLTLRRFKHEKGKAKISEPVSGDRWVLDIIRNIRINVPD
jgi:hypothetical protein